MLKVGDKFPVWFNPEAKVLEILPYKGSYIESFNCVLVLDCKDNRTAKSMGMAYWNE